MQGLREAQPAAAVSSRNADGARALGAAEEEEEEEEEEEDAPAVEAKPAPAKDGGPPYVMWLGDSIICDLLGTGELGWGHISGLYPSLNLGVCGERTEDLVLRVRTAGTFCPDYVRTADGGHFQALLVAHCSGSF